MVLYEDHYVRGRNPGEIMARFREGLSRGGRVQHVEEIFGAVKAIEAVLSTLQPGDLVLLQADTVDETVDFVRRYLSANQTAREVNLSDALATATPTTPVLGQASRDSIAARPNYGRSANSDCVCSLRCQLRLTLRGVHLSWAAHFSSR